MKLSHLEDVLRNLVYSNVSQTEVWGLSPQPLGNFCKFLEKRAILIPLVTFRTCLEPFERTRFLTRGGVEDTRLEAKDTKKSEAKAKDSLSDDKPSRGQGPTTQAQVFSKKSLQKSFSGKLQSIGGARNFDWGGPNHKSHAMTSSKLCLLALNEDFAKREGLN